MSSAQLEISPADETAAALAGQHSESPRPGALRQQMAERIAQHRQRRSYHGHSAVQLFEDSKPEGRNKIAATVAERYAQSPSYRAFLADEAQKAIRQAAAAAEVAVRSAEAVATAQKELLAELELWTAPQEFTAETAVMVEPAKAEPTPVPTPEPVRQISSAGITVKLYEDVGRAAILSAPAKLSVAPFKSLPAPPLDDEEYLALDEEIAFRKEPVFDDFRDFSAPVEPIAANLLSFPRQLIATKKARPRLAEGPLRDEPASRAPQLRIFEVEAEQISPEPPPSSAPEWSSIHLDAHSVIEPFQAPDDDTAIMPTLLPPHTAAVSQRLMAAAVDFTLVSATFLAFAATAAYVAGSVPTGAAAATTSAVVFAILYLSYQLLFFTFSDQTPGMRYARIGLCTFTDENPSRSAMRKRILATVVAACPFAIGLLWVWLDDDRLGWHDRISRMYQRSY
ncbi:RDD family protein [Granulicella tundricola]|uniref:RDD domain containing protein n=1 Tax=Granulicella tundricola (strain ATCC BAA-1859 / DSM 23138 / MP5ACTX9) TaxID=1198114 RepID=E8X5P2_GRATM|nr:RDD family protein [Granulicella tundricola]ADW70669.1 RDD domain containing protein [Granulicella tundricola MP5ACTX9]